MRRGACALVAALPVGQGVATGTPLLPLRPLLWLLPLPLLGARRVGGRPLTALRRWEVSPLPTLRGLLVACGTTGGAALLRVLLAYTETRAEQVC